MQTIYGVAASGDIVQITGVDAQAVAHSDALTRLQTALGVAQGGSGAWTKISSGTISSPVAYFDVALPSGYSLFSIKIQDLQFSASDFIAAAFSFDNGATFLNDVVNFDSYSAGLYFGDDTQDGNLVGGGSIGDATLFNFGDPVGSNDAIPPMVDIAIKPGSASSLAGLYGFLSVPRTSSTRRAVMLENYVNPDATVTPTPARATTIRWLPYGNGDVAPPTGGHTVTSGSWTLLGLSE
jgi:hypothetical protein